MTEKRYIQLTNMVRRQIASAIDDDIKGGESLMKEVFEQIYDNEDKSVVLHEMRSIMNSIRQRIV